VYENVEGEDEQGPSIFIDRGKEGLP